MKIEIDFPAIKFDENFIRKLDLPTLFKAEMLTTATRIKKETQQGRTADGGALKAYSPSYAAWRAKHHLSTRTNLTISGVLSGSMEVKTVSPNEATIAFAGDHPPAERRTVARDKPRKSRKPKIEKPRKPQKSIANAALASALIAKGFTGWFSYARKDIDRIKSSVLKKINSQLKSLLTTN